MKEPLKINIPSLSIAELSRAFLGAQIAARNFSEARGTLIENMQRHIENERWRNDPLEIKKRFLDPVPDFVAANLRAIIDK
jgi:hypothetical protein